MLKQTNSVDGPRLFDLLEETLTRAVVLATGNDEATPRPGQLELAQSILDTMLTGSHVAAEAPTGSGKSFAAGVPAMLLAATREERTVISTETLGLQSQLIGKDLPVVAQAVKDVTGVLPTFAVLKGWSNFTCAAASVSVAAGHLGIPADSVTPDPDGIADLLDQLDPNTPELVRWALQSVVDDTSGDRATFTGQCTGDEWQRVSVSTDECLGVKECPFGPVCRPAKAKALAGEADVLVTNHAMLGVQAVTTAPVVIGSKQIGPIDHLVIDEAHGLPNVVRNQGATNIGAVALLNILRAVERAADIHGLHNSLRLECFTVGLDLDEHLARMLGHRSTVTAAYIEDTPGWDVVMDNVRSWLERAKALVPSPKGTRVMADIRARKSIIARIDDLSDMLGAVERNPKEFARWVAKEHVPTKVPKALAGATGATLHISPVDVGPMLRGTVYAGGPPATSDTVTPDPPPSVTLLSATLPQSVVITSGLRVRRDEYPSPFADAYERSLLFVPKVAGSELDSFAPRTEGTGRRSFSTTDHPAWAVSYMADLVTANRGSALVLSATTTAGRYYVDQLRERLSGITVYSQWDGGSIRQVVDLWREDTGSVLVGTRSLMTGVDAPGGTCTMVVIDRVPRSAGNPVDDARVSSLMDRLEIDQWRAKQMVYVGDAALLMEQASGRLIRSKDDSGVVAVLDPRLLRSSPIAYKEVTRKALIAALSRFPHKVSSLDAVLASISEGGAASTAV